MLGWPFAFTVAEACYKGVKKSALFPFFGSRTIAQEARDSFWRDSLFHTSLLMVVRGLHVSQ